MEIWGLKNSAYRAKGQFCNLSKRPTGEVPWGYGRGQKPNSHIFECVRLQSEELKALSCNSRCLCRTQGLELLAIHNL